MIKSKKLVMFICLLANVAVFMPLIVNAQLVTQGEKDKCAKASSESPQYGGKDQNECCDKVCTILNGSTGAGYNLCMSDCQA